MGQTATPVSARFPSGRSLCIGIAVLFTAAVGLYLLVDSVLMPAYTRHDAIVDVPDLRGMTLDAARDSLLAWGFGMGPHEEYYVPGSPLNRILDQNPAAGTPIKPGRSVYVTVNAKERPKTTVPEVEGSSLRDARHRLKSAGLEIRAEKPDPLPSPYRNNITRQDPSPGEVVERGDSVSLWYGTGPGNTTVTVPDVTGLTVSAAKIRLREDNLWSVVLDLDEEEVNPVVVRQSPVPGVHVREGFEIRLFPKEAE